jgi:hypothetical protein
LDRYDWLSVSTQVADDAHGVTIFLGVGPRLRQLREVCGWRFPVTGRDAGIQQTISSKALLMAADPEGFIKDVFQRMVRELQPLITELDPRIGTLWSLPRDPTPLLLCPLFDPPKKIWPAWQSVPGVQAQSCPFCHEEFTRDRMPMWAGGDLRWAHSGCWGPDLVAEQGIR